MFLLGLIFIKSMHPNHRRKMRHWIKPLPQNGALVWKPHCYSTNMFLMPH